MKKILGIFTMVLIVGLSTMSFADIKNDTVSTVYHTSIDGELTTENTIAVISTLQQADDNDIVEIYLDSPGGNIFLMLYIIDAMNHTKAHVVTKSGVFVASAATMIFFNAKDHRINPLSVFVFHTVQSNGPITELNPSAENRSLAILTKDLETGIFKNLLTDIEYYDMFVNGENIWLLGSRIISREAALNAG